MQGGLRGCTLSCLCVIGLVIGACGPERAGEPIAENKFPLSYAASICDEIAECGCSSEAWSDSAGCSQFFERLLSAQQEAAILLGLKYDGECTRDLIAAAATSPCNAAASPNCQIYSGTTEKGSSCEPLGYSHRMGTCSPSAVCSVGFGICVDLELTPPSRPLAAGEQCLDERNDLVGYCTPVEAWYCSLDESVPSCAPKALLGSDCSSLPSGPGLCELGAYCGDTSICLAQREEGEGCSEHAECMSRLCVDNLCRTAFTKQCALASF